LTLDEEDREDLLDEVISYIKSGNAGMDDILYDIAYATCKNDGDLRELAKRFENLDQHWPLEHARQIYRRIGDRKQYLELRNKRLHYGMDYYDLVAFYWENGEKIKAVETARKGMELAEGRMDELRIFLADRAKEDGDREAYLDYIFAQRTDYLTLSSYKELEKECRKGEWVKYEGKIIDLLEKNFNIQAVKIYMYRKEYDMALRYFKSPFRSTYRIFGESELFSIAKRLEVLYPEEILAFYRSSVGNVNVSASRKIYAQNALAIMRVRRVLVEVMKRPEEWKTYALKIKSNNAKRPAFQEEFTRVIPDWDSL
jgi:tetratricopeptide (TPR) repeat protein